MPPALRAARPVLRASPCDSVRRPGPPDTLSHPARPRRECARGAALTRRPQSVSRGARQAFDLRVQRGAPRRWRHTTQRLDEQRPHRPRAGFRDRAFRWRVPSCPSAAPTEKRVTAARRKTAPRVECGRYVTAVIGTFPARSATGGRRGRRGPCLVSACRRRNQRGKLVSIACNGARPCLQRDRYSQRIESAAPILGATAPQQIPLLPQLGPQLIDRLRPHPHQLLANAHAPAGSPVAPPTRDAPRDRCPDDTPRPAPPHRGGRS